MHIYKSVLCHTRPFHGFGSMAGGRCVIWGAVVFLLSVVDWVFTSSDVVSIVCAKNNTVLLGTSLHCRPGWLSTMVQPVSLGSWVSGSNLQYTRFFPLPSDWDGICVPTHTAAHTLGIVCDLDQDPIFRQGMSGVLYLCACKKGLWRVSLASGAVDTKCISCGSNYDCPRYTNTRVQHTPPRDCGLGQMGTDSGDGCVCRAGFYVVDSSTDDTKCVRCMTGQFCPGQTHGAQNCSKVTEFTQFPGAADNRSCMARSVSTNRCMPGEHFLSNLGCAPCPLGYYCAGAKVKQCPYAATTLRVGTDNIHACVCTVGRFKRVVANINDAFVCEKTGSNVWLREPRLQGTYFRAQTPFLQWLPTDEEESVLLGAVLSYDYLRSPRGFELLVCSNIDKVSKCHRLQLQSPTTPLGEVTMLMFDMIASHMHKFTVVVILVEHSKSRVHRIKFQVEFQEHSQSLVETKQSSTGESVLTLNPSAVTDTLSSLPAARAVVVAQLVQHSVTRTIVSDYSAPDNHGDTTVRLESMSVSCLDISNTSFRPLDLGSVDARTTTTALPASMQGGSTRFINFKARNFNVTQGQGCHNITVQNITGTLFIPTCRIVDGATNCQSQQVTHITTEREELLTNKVQVSCLYTDQYLETQKKVELSFNISTPTRNINLSTTSPISILFRKDGVCADVSIGNHSATLFVRGCRVVPVGTMCGVSGATVGVWVPLMHSTWLHLGHTYSAGPGAVRRMGELVVRREFGGLVFFYLSLGVCVREGTGCVYSARTHSTQQGLPQSCDTHGVCSTVAVSLQQHVLALCAVGYARNISDNSCVLCAHKTFCVAGMAYSCPPWSSGTVPARGAVSVKDCMCDGGYFMHDAQRCELCPVGMYCPPGRGRLSCPLFSSTENVGSNQKGQCLCNAGYYDEGGGACVETGTLYFSTALDNERLLCRNNSRHVVSILAGECVCDAGFYAIESVLGGECVSCKMETPCPVGSTEKGEPCGSRRVVSADKQTCVCEAGYFASASGGGCVECISGYYCNAVAQTPLRRCPYEMSSSVGAVGDMECFCQRPNFVRIAKGGCGCNPHYYSTGGDCIPCPAHSHTIGAHSKTVESCVCDPGFFRENSSCTQCVVGHYCIENMDLPCPVGTFGPAAGQGTVESCLPCPNNGSRVGASVPSDCVNSLLVFSLDHAHTDIFDSMLTQTIVLATFHAGQSLGSLSTNLTASVRALTGSDDVEIQHSTSVASLHTVRLRAPGTAIAQVVAALAATTTSNAWQKVRELTATHINTYELVAHAVFCDFVRTDPSVPLRAKVSCQTHGTAVPSDSVVQEQMRKVARSFLVGRGFSLDVLYDSSKFWNWQMDPGLHSVLQVVQQNLKRGSVSVAMWNNEDTFLNDIVVHRHAAYARGQFVLLSHVAETQPIQSAYFDSSLPDMGVTHGTCNKAVEVVSGSCAGITTQGGGVLCRFCQSGQEFLQSDGVTCQSCNKAVACAGISLFTSVFMSCCQSSDNVCVYTPVVNECGNYKHDLFEECDKTANTPLSQCCTNSCGLMAGFYAVPACSTYCGDGIVAAPVEECEPSVGNVTCGRDCKFV